MRHADRFNMSVVGSKPEESQKASESPDGCASTHKLSAYYEKRKKARTFLFHVVVMSNVEAYICVWSS